MVSTCKRAATGHTITADRLHRVDAERRSEHEA